MALDMNNFTSNQNAQGEVKSDRKLRIGIIGTGGIAGSHIASYKKQPDVEADEASAEAASEPAEPQGVPSFDDEPQEVIDTEGATAESHEAPAAVYGGAATAPVALAHEGTLPLVDGAGEDPAATVAMPAMPQE